MRQVTLTAWVKVWTDGGGGGGGGYCEVVVVVVVEVVVVWNLTLSVVEMVW